ncbi:hypothetical protein IV203_025968 [Nitzschia inconspicua]|uniref:Uncharacterized protein n=1 Tax=Nitzschia inconspicua TaxID=303405 RepID=A0A9K3LHS0_9STRA|nr:hypothetical protein IV203_025968 [Nitzschia inconspicua]
MRFETSLFLAVVAIIAMFCAPIDAQLRGQSSRIRNADDHFASFYNQVDATMDSIKARRLQKADKEEKVEVEEEVEDELEEDLSLSMSLSMSL